MERLDQLKAVKLYLFDMDGTLYLDDVLFPFTTELLKAIRSYGGRYLFLTNNSAKSVKDYVLKLERLGISATEADFLTSSQATAFYLKKHHKDATLYVCGTSSLKEELTCEGFTVTEELNKVDCIVMGNDQELTFQKLYDVSKLLLTRKGIPYIATNPDYVCPTAFGSVPDCGSICDMLYNVAKRYPIFVGKPQALMPQLAMEKAGCTPEQTAVVGDRIYTDIKSGINAGTVTVLVMSGETTAEILEASPDKPDIVMQDAGEILQFLKAGIK